MASTAGGAGQLLAISDLHIGYEENRAHGTGIVCNDEYLLHPDPYPSREAWCRARVAETEHRLAALPDDLPTILVNHYRPYGLSRSESAQPHAPNGLGRTGPRRTQPRGGDTHPVRGPGPGGQFPLRPGHMGYGQRRRGGPEPSRWWSRGPARRRRIQRPRSPSHVNPDGPGPRKPGSRPSHDRAKTTLWHPEFAMWCGTGRTADRHRRFCVEAMVYGHLHIPRTTWFEGVRFEEVSVGYPREWRKRQEPPGRLRRILPRKVETK